MQSHNTFFVLSISRAHINYEFGYVLIGMMQPEKNSNVQRMKPTLILKLHECNELPYSASHYECVWFILLCMLYVDTLLHANYKRPKY